MILYKTESNDDKITCARASDVNLSSLVAGYVRPPTTTVVNIVIDSVVVTNTSWCGCGDSIASANATAPRNAEMNNRSCILYDIGRFLPRLRRSEQSTTTTAREIIHQVWIYRSDCEY